MTLQDFNYDPTTATEKQFLVEFIPIQEKPWLRFEIRCTACKWGIPFIMMTVARAYMMAHRCGICACCDNATLEGDAFCGDTCIAQGGSCKHPLSDVLAPEGKQKQPSLIIM